MIERNGEVRTVPENILDPAAAQSARTVFEKHADTILPGRLYGAPKIDALDRLLRQSLGEGIRVGVMPSVTSIGVETHPLDWSGFAVM